MESSSNSPRVSFERIAHAEGHGLIVLLALLALWMGAHRGLDPSLRFEDMGDCRRTHHAVATRL